MAAYPVAFRDTLWLLGMSHVREDTARDRAEKRSSQRKTQMIAGHSVNVETIDSATLCVPRHRLIQPDA